jgi:4-hydroxy-3-polyprenylbenzoate decarboxylase
VIVPRETPFSLIHLRNLTTLAEAGTRIVPAIPAWYHNPQTIEDLVDFVVARVLDQLDIDCIPIQRWQGSEERQKDGSRYNGENPRNALPPEGRR